MALRPSLPGPAQILRVCGVGPDPGPDPGLSGSFTHTKETFPSRTDTYVRVPRSGGGELCHQRERNGPLTAL